MNRRQRVTTVPDADGMRCEPITDDNGEVIATAHVSGDLSERGREALRELVEAARRQFAADLEADPSIGERQDAAMRRNRERLDRIRGLRAEGGAVQDSENQP